MPEKHILHIEDNFHNRRIVRKILEKQGYQLHEAADGVIGYNMIREMCPPLVLLDISLPGMDGIEIAQKVKADDDLKHIILIAVTASAMQGDRERFLAAGCDDYLSKPFRSIDLVDLVNQYYDQIPESYMSSFRPKDVIHPIEEHSVLAGAGSWERAKQTQEAPAEPERRFFSKENKEMQAEEEGSESIESSQDIGLLKTASLQGIFTEDELNEYLEYETPLEEEAEGVEESPEAMPAMTLGGEAENEEANDEETTWVMPRNIDEPINTKSLEGLGGETMREEAVEEAAPETFDVIEEEDLPGGEEYPVEELFSRPVKSLEESGAADTASLPGMLSEEELEELDKLEEKLKETTFEADEAEAPMAEALTEAVEMQAESGEEEGDEIPVWGEPAQTDELLLDTDFLQATALEQAPEEVGEEEATPELASPTEVIERLMAFSDEGPAIESELESEEEQAELETLLEEMATTAPEVEDILAAEPALEAEEEAWGEPAASLDEMTATAPEAEDVLATEPALEAEEEAWGGPAASLDELTAATAEAEDVLTAEPALEAEEEETHEPTVLFDEITTSTLEAEGVLATEPALEAEEEAWGEPAVPFDEMTAATAEAEDVLTAEPALEAEEEAWGEPEALLDEIEIGTMEAGEEFGLEKKPEIEQVEASKETPAGSRLDDTSPLRAQFLEPSAVEEAPSEGPSDGDGREHQSRKKEKENLQQKILADKVVQMINPEMIRPVDPNVGLESA
jgi:two-component system cell cycle response regulator DivK